MARPRLDIEPILDAGMNVMYARGYNATGMQDIATAAGMTKGAIYGYFEGKEDFAVQSIRHYTDKMVHYLEQALLHDEGRALGRLRTMWSDWAKNQFTKYNGCGCFAANMSQEMSNHSEAIRKATKESLDSLEKVYKKCLDLARAEGDLAADADTRFLASFVFNGWQGSMLRAKAEKNSAHLKAYHQHIFKNVLV